jgi:zinc protease
MPAPRRSSASPKSPPDLPAVPDDVTLVTLENGLTVILREDHSAPVVSAQAWCCTGSIHEGRWLGAGLSHVLEHMLFKGTTTRGPGRIDQEVQDAGGYMNAYTSFDRTVYWINVPSGGTETAVDILCDITQHATLPSEELAKELDVIRREMAMNHDDPGRRAGRRLFETAYTRSPYRFTVIGYPDIFGELTPADIHAYYRERYAPNNVFFVVVGDIDTQRTLHQIKESFAQTKARPIPPMVLPEEPSQTAPREVLEEAPIELGHVHLCWHIPELRHPDVPILDVLAALLGSGRSSRLQREVLEKQGLVHSVDAWTYNPGGSGLFGVSAILDGPRFAPARQALLAEIQQLQQRPVPTAELRKGIKQFLTGTLATRKTMQGQAQDLGGSWLLARDLNFSERYLEAVRRIKPADLQRVARQYLQTSTVSLYALLPTGCTPRPTSRISKTSENAIQRVVLPNGLRLLLKADSRLPFVEFRALFTGGVLAESPAENGATQLLARMLLKGTSNRSAEQIATEIESLGGSIDSYGANHSFGVSLETLSQDFSAGLDVFSDVLLRPTFPRKELSREIQIQIAGIRAQRDQLLKSASIAMRHALFGDSSYGLDPAGTESSVAAIRPALLRSYHRRLTTPRNAVLAIYGDIQPEKVLAAVRRTFGRWTGPQTPPFQVPVAGPLDPITRRVEEERDKTQAVLVLGFRGSRLDHPDRFALELLQEACSDLGSRLFLRIREQLGLAYYVGAQNFLGLVPGYFAFYAGTAPEHAARVELELLEETRILGGEGLTEAELRRAKAKILGQKQIARQDLSHLAMVTGLDELYGLGYANQKEEEARIEAVTTDEIRTVAARYLNPARAVLALVRPAQPATTPT